MNHPTDPEELQADIEHTREQLSETVTALAHKADIPTRVKEKAHHAEVVAEQRTAQLLAKLPEPVRRTIRTAAGAVRRRPAPYAAGALVVLLLIRRIAR